MDELLEIANDSYLSGLMNPRSTAKLQKLHGGLVNMMWECNGGRITGIYSQLNPDYIPDTDEDFEMVDGEWRLSGGLYDKDVDIVALGVGPDGDNVPFSYTQVKFPVSNVSQNYRNYIENSFGDIFNVRLAIEQNKERAITSEFWIMPVTCPYFSDGVVKRIDVIDPGFFVNAVESGYASQSSGIPEYYSLNFVDVVGIYDYVGATREQVIEAFQTGDIWVDIHGMADSSYPRLLINNPLAWAAYITGADYVDDFIGSSHGVYRTGHGDFYCAECGWEGHVTGNAEGFAYCPGCGTPWRVD